MKARLTILFLFLTILAGAQESSVKGIPRDVYYWMPDFADGMIYFRGQGPAQGKVNICAEDNTLRFIDKEGNELVAADADNIVMVRIDTVSFLRTGGTFYRMYPLADDFGLALKRRVRIVWDAKQGAYGSTSLTSSIKEYSSIYSEGGLYELNKDKVYPYDVTETLFLYRGQDIVVLNKNNLKKLFPDRKEEIEAFFKAGNNIPDKADDALALLSQWSH